MNLPCLGPISQCSSNVSSSSIPRLHIVSSSSFPRSSISSSRSIGSRQIPARDRVIDFGKYKGKMLGTLPSKYLKWVTKNLRARDFEEWANLADQVLSDPVYKDRVEWEFAQALLNGDVPVGTQNAVSELLEISTRFGWDNDDKLGWSKIDFDMLGTGEDTRRTFTNQLYEALVDVGLRTFKDDNEIERGENIKSELDKAIHQSKGSIIVLSKNYASSSWCLDELVVILENNKNRGHVILLVFYYVDSSDVGKQSGSFAIAFARHEKKLLENSEDSQAWAKRIELWRKALKKIASLGGMTLQGQNERNKTKFIEKIVKVIEEKINRSVIGIAPYLIGIHSRAKDLNLWLNNRIGRVSIAGVCGMGGIGKTTIAKYVFNVNYDNFEGSSFLENTRQYSEYEDGLIHMQRQFLADILRGKETEVQSIEEGIYQIKAAINGKRVLVVLDDIDRLGQLDAVLGMRDWFHPGSRIIITTRHSELLRAYEIDMVNMVDRLTKEESFELFSWHAFGNNQPIDHYKQLSERMVKHCEGLPLALQLLGSSLSGKAVDVWESSLNKLEAIPNSQVAKKLKVSYDSLQDDHDQNLFLDVACFFVAKNINIVATVLEGCGYYVIVGIQNLIDRFLLTIDQNEKVVMHQSVRDMGRDIVRQESTRDPGKRTRLWHYKDCITVLDDKTSSPNKLVLSVVLGTRFIFLTGHQSQTHPLYFISLVARSRVRVPDTGVDLEEISESPSLTRNPVTDLLEFGQAAQSASQYAEICS
ncbi:hypothetical protein T459_35205 [Capsicum annuum]|uniref:TIR domain-containing protein n=1 Tax=Capsicum annuum TaxID=4072 RepID=A0A2G2XTX8_CAPAN|nr:hypothetical protein T459_35205 [Capsicum annuum]